MSKVKNKLFFESDEEDETNVLKKNKKIFSDEPDDLFGDDINNEVASFNKRREEQLRELREQDKKNEKDLEKLKKEAQQVLQGSVRSTALQAPSTPVESDTLANFFEENEEAADNTEGTKQTEAQKLQHEAKQNLNEQTKGVFAPAGSIEWDDKESIAIKAQIEEQKKQTLSLLFDDDDNDEHNDDSALLAKFSSTSLYTKATTQPAEPHTTQPTASKPTENVSKKIDLSLFEDDDDSVPSIPPTAIDFGATKDATNKPSSSTASSQFMSLFDDDDDTTTAQSDDIGDNFDFSAYITSQK